MDRYGRLIQLEVSIVGMLFVNAAAALGGYECSIGAYRIRAIVAGPVVESIHARCRRRHRSLGRSGIHLHRFGFLGNRALVRAIGSHRIVDDYFVFLPHGEHGMIRMVLIRRDFGRFIAIVTIFSGLGIERDLSRADALGPVCLILLPCQRLLHGYIVRRTVHRNDDPVPAEEFIPGRINGGVRNGDRLVYGKIIILLEGFRSIIVIPINMGLDFLVFLDIHCLEQDLIGILFVRIKVRRRNYGAGLVVGDLRIVQFYFEGVRREHDLAVCVAGTGPVLDHPVTKHIIRIRGRGGWSRDGLSTVHIGVRVRPLVAARANIVYHVDAFSADQLAAPLRVEIHLADGRRIGRVDFVGGIEMTEFGDHRAVRNEGIEAERLSIVRVRIPSSQLIIDTGAAHVANHITLIDIEGVAATGIRTRVAVRVHDAVFRGIAGDQVDLIFVVTPLGKEAQGVRRHGVEIIGIADAKGVIIPAQEGIPVQSGREIVGIPADVRLKIDVVSRGKIGAGRRSAGHRISAAVHKGTVAIGDVVLVPSITNVQIVIDIAGVPITAYIFSIWY